MIAMLINCVAEKTNAHSGTIQSVFPDGTHFWSAYSDGTIRSVAFSPDGTKIVSGSNDGTIKVWDSGALLPSNHFSCVKTDACWLVWQARWCS